MTGPLAGFKVVELATYAMVPFAGAIMADWGASVIKIEHPFHGDSVRHATAWNIPAVEGCSSYMYAVANRGKRSIGLDVSTAEGRRVLDELLRDADVFLTNFLPDVLTRLKVEAADIHAVNPRTVYARGSGYGPRGDEAHKGGFDGAVYWSRSGMVQAVTPPDLHPLRMPGPGSGDSQCGTGLAAGVLAALLQRERGGPVVDVDSSLLMGGMWAMAMSYAALASAGRDSFIYPERLERADNPLTFPYRTAEGRFVHISMVDSDRYWPGLCEAIGHPGLIADPRFATKPDRSKNRAELVSLLDRVFGEMPLAHWKEALAQQKGPWSVVTLPGELQHDAQALANDYIQQVPWDQGRQLPMVPAPAQFDRRSPALGPTPQLGEHTSTVLAELGMDAQAIASLRAARVIA